MLNNEKNNDIELNFDFGNCSATVAAALTLVLQYAPKSALLDYMINWLETDNSAFNFNILENEHGISLLKEINNSSFSSSLLTVKCEDSPYKLSTIIKAKLENTEFGITKDELENIINELYK